jgi:hypothetical protein
MPAHAPSVTVFGKSRRPSDRVTYAYWGGSGSGEGASIRGVGKPDTELAAPPGAALEPGDAGTTVGALEGVLGALCVGTMPRCVGVLDAVIGVFVTLRVAEPAADALPDAVGVPDSVAAATLAEGDAETQTTDICPAPAAVALLLSTQPLLLLLLLLLSATHAHPADSGEREAVGDGVAGSSTGSVSVVILIEEALTSVSLLRSQISPAATCIASSIPYEPHTPAVSG